MVRHPALLTCREVVEVVTELLGETLAPEDRIRLEQHLLVCPPCTGHVAQVRATIQLAGELRARPASEPAPEPAPPAAPAGSPAAAAALAAFRAWKRS